MDAFNRILVPVDFSAHSDLALRYATTLADRFGATVEVLHVVEDPFCIRGMERRRLIAPNIPELLADLVTAARAKLADLKDGRSQPGSAPHHRGPDDGPDGTSLRTASPITPSRKSST